MGGGVVDEPEPKRSSLNMQLEKKLAHQAANQIL